MLSECARESIIKEIIRVRIENLETGKSTYVFLIVHVNFSIRVTCDINESWVSLFISLLINKDDHP